MTDIAGAENEAVKGISADRASSILESLGGVSGADLAHTSSSTHRTGVTTSVEDRAISLLGSGCSQEDVAAALGVTPSRISQMLSEATFADRVADARYKNLQAHNERDGKYDTVEDKLLHKLESTLPLLVRPEAILGALKIVNSAKRRGQSAPSQTVNQQNIVNLVMPDIIAQRFAVNIDNQVVKAGEQNLITMPSGDLLKRVEEATDNRLAAPATGE